LGLTRRTGRNVEQVSNLFQNVEQVVNLFQNVEQVFNLFLDMPQVENLRYSRRLKTCATAAGCQKR
jgi:hypothetical protein